MKRLIDLILGLIAAIATALLLGLIAHDGMGMPIDMIRIDALAAASLVFAAVAGGSVLKWKKLRHPASGLKTTPSSSDSSEYARLPDLVGR